MVLCLIKITQICKDLCRDKREVYYITISVYPCLSNGADFGLIEIKVKKH